MKQLLCIGLLLVGTILVGYSQSSVGIGTTMPHSSAILHIESSTKGLLMPRMDSTARNNIANPIQGLMVYDTSYRMHFIYDNNIWKYIRPEANQQLSIVAGTTVLDFTKGSDASILLNGDITLQVTNAIKGVWGQITIKQDATGNRKLLLPLGSLVSYNGSGVLPLSATPNAIDVVTYWYNGSQFLWSVISNFN